MSLIMIYGLNTWLPKLMNEAGYPLGSSLTFLLALNIGATVGSVLMGWLADRWGAKKSIIMFYLIASITITSLGFATNMILLYVLVALAGASTMGTQNLTNAYISQYYPASIRSTGLGWASGIGRIGGILGTNHRRIFTGFQSWNSIKLYCLCNPWLDCGISCFLYRSKSKTNYRCR